MVRAGKLVTFNNDARNSNDARDSGLNLTGMVGKVRKKNGIDKKMGGTHFIEWLNGPYKNHPAKGYFRDKDLRELTETETVLFRLGAKNI